MEGKQTSGIRTSWFVSWYIVVKQSLATLLQNFVFLSLGGRSTENYFRSYKIRKRGPGAAPLFAPGVDLLSSYYTSNTATAIFSGTSGSAPLTAGVAARALLMVGEGTLEAESRSRWLVGIPIGSPEKLSSGWGGRPGVGFRLLGGSLLSLDLSSAPKKDWAHTETPPHNLKGPIPRRH